MNIFTTIEDELFSTESDNKKKWMQEESKKEKNKGTTGSLREYFKLKKEDVLTVEMLDKELEKLKKKYIKDKDSNFPPDVLAIVRKINLAKIYLKASEKRKNKKSTEDMDLFISEESLNTIELEIDTVKTVIDKYFH